MAALMLRIGGLSGCILKVCLLIAGDRHNGLVYAP